MLACNNVKAFLLGFPQEIPELESVVDVPVTGRFLRVLQRKLGPSRGSFPFKAFVFSLQSLQLSAGFLSFSLHRFESALELFILGLNFEELFPECQRFLSTRVLPSIFDFSFLPQLLELRKEFLLCESGVVGFDFEFFFQFGLASLALVKPESEFLRQSRVVFYQLRFKALKLSLETLSFCFEGRAAFADFLSEWAPLRVLAGSHLV